MVAFVQKGADENVSDGKTFVTSEEDNKKYLITDPAWRTTLGVISAISVLSCCVISQLIIMWSRKSQLKLNKYYSRKKFEKDQLIQYITREQYYLRQEQKHKRGDIFRQSNFAEGGFDPYLMPALNTGMSPQTISARGERGLQQPPSHRRDNPAAQMNNINLEQAQLLQHQDDAVSSQQRSSLDSNRKSRAAHRLAQRRMASEQKKE